MDDLKQFEPLWDSWRAVSVLGEGSFGKVYKIERQEFSNTYVAALKHIRVPQSRSEVKSVMADGMDEKSVRAYFESAVEEIINEFVLMSKLKGNSHIVSYEDHKVIEDKNEIGWDIFIRMELLTSLIDYIQKNSITKRNIIKLGIDICKALELCQKHNIIHRDIKPENIFVTENGDFKLGDFGIARQIEKTAAGLSKKGTFTYIAPEVYKGEPYGSTVDIYSLGIVMYRLLNNNRVPFMPPYPQPITRTDREIGLVKRMSGQPIEKPVNADGRLAEIVLKACAFNPKERYNSPLLMRMELEAILYNEAEAGIIYPKGDNADIHSINYIDTNSDRTETMALNDTVENAETQLMTSTEIPLFGANVGYGGAVKEEPVKITDKVSTERVKGFDKKVVAGALAVALGIGCAVGIAVKYKEYTAESTQIENEIQTETTTEPQTEAPVTETTTVATTQATTQAPTQSSPVAQSTAPNKTATSAPAANKSTQTKSASTKQTTSKTSSASQGTASAANQSANSKSVSSTAKSSASAVSAPVQTAEPAPASAAPAPVQQPAPSVSDEAPEAIGDFQD